MNIDGKKVCVTGAGGFLGSSLCRALVSRNANVVAIDNFSVGTPTALQDLKSDLEIVMADVRDLDSLRGHLPDCEVVFHLAAIDNRTTCQRDFALAFDVNVKGTSNVLSLCSGAERVIFASSTMVYGEPRYLPIDEVHPLDGYEPYAVTKIAGEYLCRAFRFNQDLRFTIVRNSNTYGPGQGKDYLVPSLIIQGLTQEQIEVWTPTVIRDFQYVDNCIEGLIIVAESESTLGETINLGTGRGITTGECTELICSQLETTWIDRKKPAPVSSKLICDIAKLELLTGWKPNIELKEGLRLTIEHYRSLIGCGSDNGKVS